MHFNWPLMLIVGREELSQRPQGYALNDDNDDDDDDDSLASHHVMF